MAIRVRRGSDADRLTVILEEGEVAFTTDTQMFYVGDNATLGGILIGPGAVVPTAWGTITGVLANQLDLQAALNAKEPTIVAGLITDYWRGDKSWQPFPSIPVVTPAALTRVNDTNVTLTLGGTPTLALLQAASLTLGWTGTLADARIASSATWNAKQDAITLTTIGTSGAATFIANTLNIPNYADTGITTLNTLVALTQTFAVGTSGTDFAINSAISTHTFDLPTASAINRGALNSTDWTTFNSKQTAITLTTLGTSGASTLIGATLNIPQYTDTYVGTVTSVAALTLGTTGVDLSSTVVNSTTTPVITLNVPTASVLNRGALSAADWSTFNSKQDAITLTTTGTTGASTFIANTLNIPSYADQFVGTVTSVGLTAPSAFTITGSPITTSGTLAITGAGLVSQYIDGTGALQAFPALSSGTVTNIATAGLISGGAITTTGTITTLMATNRLVGRGTALSGVMEEIILGTNLSLTGTTLNATNSGGTVTSVTATTPVVSTGGTTPVISMPAATTLVDGYLTSADWTTFNNKGNGTVLSVTAAPGDPIIVDNIDPANPVISSGILVQSVTATSLITSSGGVTPDISTSIQTNKLVGRGTALTGVFEEITLGTNLSLTGTTLNAANSGGTVTSVSGTLNKIDSTGGTTPAIDISATYVGQTSITTLGTIGTGVWNGTTIAIANGGTGQTTATLAFDALSPTTTRGDTIVRGVTNNVRLALGTVGKILRSDGTDLVYTTATYPTTTAISTLLYSSAANVISALATANSGILVTSATGVPSISAQLTYVTTTGVLTSILSVNSNSRIMVTNANVGVAAACDIVANNGTSAIYIAQRGTAFTTTGLIVANQGQLGSTATSSMLINTSVASVPIIFAVGGTAATNEVHRSTSSGIEFRVLLKSLVHSAANLMAGQITLVGGTLATTITGLTTSHRGMVTLVTANNVLNTRSYQAVCTANTITIRANTDTGLLNIADTSVLNYFIFLNN